MRIHSKFLLSILTFVLSTVLTVTLVAINISSHSMEKLVKDNAELLSQSYSIKLESKVMQVKRSAGDIAAYITTTLNAKEVLSGARRRYPEVSRIFYAGLDGSIKNMSPYSRNLLGYNFSGTTEWESAIKYKDIYISNPAKYVDQRVLFVYAPIFDNYVGRGEPEVVGVLVLAISEDFFFKDIHGFEYGDTGSLFVINYDGVFICHQDSSYVMKKRVVDLPATTGLLNIESSMKSLSTGFETYYNGSQKKFLSFTPIANAKWSLSITGNYSDFTEEMDSLVRINIIILLFGIIYATVVISIIVKGLVKPITVLTNMAARISRGDMSCRSRLDSNDELGVLSKTIDKMVDRLENYNKVLEVDVEERTKDLRSVNKKLLSMNQNVEVVNKELSESRDFLWNEMELTQKLQETLLPEEPTIPGLQISAYMKTTGSVGGDFYDVINVGGRNWFLIGDVSGHGVTAGIIMMMVHTSIHTVLSQNPNISPKDLLTIINNTVYSNILALGGSRYTTLTVFACQDNSIISFAGAHLPVIIYRADRDLVEIVETQGTWVGLVDNVSGLNDNRELYLGIGDIILLYTDGICEATTSSGEMFSQKELAELFKCNVGLDAKSICGAMKEFSSQLIVDDDFTFMVLKKVSNEI